MTYNLSPRKWAVLSVLGIVLLSACEKETLDDLALLPQLSWTALSAENDQLQISVAMVHEAGILPKGTGHFSVNGGQIDKFPLALGTYRPAPFTFSDNEEHIAEVRFVYEDGSQTLRTAKKIQRQETVRTTTAQASEWTDMD